MLIRAWICLLGLALLACAAPPAGKPVVSILSPVEGARVTLNEPVVVLVAGAASGNVARLELKVDGVAAGILTNTGGTPALSAPFKITPARAGIIALDALAFDEAGRPSDAARVQIIVEAAPSAAPASTPAPAGQPTRVAEPAGVPADCKLDSAFVADVSIPDNTVIRADDTFVKIWRLKNASSCDWGTGLELVHISGPRMDALPAVGILPTRRNENVDVSMAFVAPKNGGTYTSLWQLRAPGNKLFGTKFYVTIKVIE